MHIPSLVIDLAMMLLAAGIVSVIFRKIHLPVILGYIAVGFLISPYFPMFFNVEDVPAIDTLSEIGVIIILFHIGLEFDFHKLLSVGSTAIVTALVKMSGVLVVGYLFGDLIGLSQMNCIFLGTMLAISSTVVIQKCFEDLKVTGERYTASMPPFSAISRRRSEIREATAAASHTMITPARIVTVSDSSGVYLRSSSARMLPMTAAAAARITISIHSLKPEQIADQIKKLTDLLHHDHQNDHETGDARHKRLILPARPREQNVQHCNKDSDGCNFKYQIHIHRALSFAGLSTVKV